MMERHSSARWVLAAFAALVIAPSFLPQTAAAQFGTRAEPQVVSVFLPAPREIRRQLSEAEAAINEGRFSEAVEVLGAILAESDAEDYFLSADSQEGMHVSLKAQATKLLGMMPAKGRQQYEDRFGAEARRMFDDAVVSGNLHALADITRMYFHTEAGYAATMLLGRYRLDEGRPLAAALCFKRLLDSGGGARYEPQLSLLLANCWLVSGQRETARDVLLDLKRRQPGASFRIGDEEVKLFTDDADALAWLERSAPLGRFGQQGDAAQWAIFRGDPARNARSKGAMPLQKFRWKQLNFISIEEEEIAQRLVKQYQDRSVPAMPAFQPVAVKDLILMRTPERLMAVDFHTGKGIWEYPWFSSNHSAGAEAMPRGGNGSASPLDDQLGQRLFEDAAYGQVASDGKYVYMLDKVGYASVNRYNRVIIGAGGVPRTSNSSESNELVALQLETQGKLHWVVGGEAGGEEPRLAGAFFLGPPLPLLGQLYVLAEFNGEIRLVVIDARTGELEWAQQVALLEGQSVVYDRTRRLAGATPSFADGVLVCPTSAGAVVAVDAATRTLLWGYQYKRDHVNQPRFRGVVSSTQRALGSRWDDATVTIDGGRVLLTPVESNEMLCLDLFTGQSLWETNLPRGEMLFVAGIDQDRAIVVGKNTVRAVQLADGEIAWEMSLDGMPSGRGFISDGNYFQATTNSEVVKISLADGEIVKRSKTLGVLGNLICYQDEVISQGYDEELRPSLTTYFQDGSLREKVSETLRNNPDDLWALARQGELLLEEGEFTRAVASLRKAHTHAPTEEHRLLLIDAMLAALRDDYDANRALAEEAEALIGSSSRRDTLLRYRASGRQDAGEMAAALRDYLELMAVHRTISDDEKPSQVLETPAPGWEIARRRWVSARIGELLASVTGRQRREIDAAVAARFEEASAADGPQLLRDFVDCFVAHPRAADAKRLLASRLLETEAGLDCELLLADLSQSADDAPAAAALYCRLLEQRGQIRQAAQAYRRLEGQYGDTVCLAGKTGRELVAAIAPDSPLGEQLASSLRWNPGAVVVKTAADSEQANTIYRPTYPVNMSSWRLDGDKRMQVRIDQTKQELVISHSDGAELTRVSVARTDGGRISPNYSLVHGKGVGDLLVVSLGFEILAIDTAAAAENPSTGVLWRFDLSPEIVNGAGRLTTAAKNNPWGDPIYFSTDSMSHPVGQIAYVGESGVCFQYGERLLCLDPLSGEKVWSRRGLPLGCELFGDSERLCAIPPDGTKVLVYSTLDGRPLPERAIDLGETLWATCGSNALLWRSNNDATAGLHLRIYDAGDDKTLFQQDYPQGTKATLIDGEELAVFQPDGRITLIQLDTGAEKFSQRLTAEPQLTAIYVFRRADEYVLMTNHPGTPIPNTVVQAAPGGFYAPLVNGRLYALDQDSGKPLWSEPLEIQQYGLPLDQPKAGPVLAFLRHLSSTASGRSRITRTSLLAVDLRTGKPIHTEEFPATTSFYTLTANVAEQTVNLNLPNREIEIEFAGK